MGTRQGIQRAKRLIISNTFGFIASARAMPTRCFIRLDLPGVYAGRAPSRDRGCVQSLDAPALLMVWRKLA